MRGGLCIGLVEEKEKEREKFNERSNRIRAEVINKMCLAILNEIEKWKWINK